MNKLDRSVKHNSNLLLISIISSITSIVFLIFFSFLLAYAKDIANNKSLLITLGSVVAELQITLIVFSLIFYFGKHSEQSTELLERAKFTYILTIYVGFIFIVPLIAFRSYILSGGDKKHILRAKKEYEETQAIALTELAINDSKIKLSKDALVKIENVRQLASENFITIGEKSSYLWEILNEETNLLKEKIDYNDPKIIKKVSDILETF